MPHLLASATYVSGGAPGWHLLVLLGVAFGLVWFMWLRTSLPDSPEEADAETGEPDRLFHLADEDPDFPGMERFDVAPLPADPATAAADPTSNET